MKKLKLILMMSTILIVLTGCWNYREVDELSIVAGVAIDQSKDNQIEMTIETIDISSGKDGNKKSKIITAKGETMFDAARNMISLSGKKLYWSHAKVIILSKEIASQGVSKVIEWYTRDAETREDVKILVSKAQSAKEILSAQESSKDIKSFTLAEMLENQKSLSKAPTTDILEYSIQTKINGTSIIVPLISLEEINGQKTPQIRGSAIIKNDKLEDFLDADKTKDLLFIRNEIKGGLLIEQMQIGDKNALISFEIFGNKTNVKPVVTEDNITMEISINTIVSIAEIQGELDFFDEQVASELEEKLANAIKSRVELLISKAQSEYEADIFGFGVKLRQDKVKTWKNVNNHWEETFKALKVNVITKVKIKNSAILSKSL